MQKKITNDVKNKILALKSLFLFCFLIFFIIFYLFPLIVNILMIAVVVAFTFVPNGQSFAFGEEKLNCPPGTEAKFYFL